METRKQKLERPTTVVTDSLIVRSQSSANSNPFADSRFPHPSVASRSHCIDIGFNKSSVQSEFPPGQFGIREISRKIIP
jgi:hypothetical protein